MLITPEERILFIGDSITAAERDTTRYGDLGQGYVTLIAAQLEAELASPGLVIWNRGNNGQRIGDLLNRIEADVFALEPTLISILIGINDRFDPLGEFRDAYRAFLTQIRQRLSTQILLLEPFLLPTRTEQFQSRDPLNPKIDAVRALALEFSTELIPLDGMFAEAATRASADFWAPDGIHPSRAGHSLIAEAWLDRVELD